jgi:hypothetical protein
MYMLKPHSAGLALAATFAILWAVCAGFYAIFPQISLGLYSIIFHGFQMSVDAAPLTPVGYLSGIVYLAVAGYVIGWLFSTLYSAFCGKRLGSPD